MSNVKERIIGALTVLSEEDAEKIWYFLEQNFSKKSWDDIEEIEPEEDEKMIINDYIEGKDEYQPAMTHSELLKELNL